MTYLFVFMFSNISLPAPSSGVQTDRRCAGVASNKMYMNKQLNLVLSTYFESQKT